MPFREREGSNKNSIFYKNIDFHNQKRALAHGRLSCVSLAMKKKES
jgi:hypothetical protein